MRRARLLWTLALTLLIPVACGSSGGSATTTAAGTQPPAATAAVAASPVATSAPSPTPAATAVATPAATAVATPAPTPAPTAAQAKVEIVNFAFQPATITIAAGTTVVWTNTSPTQHTVANKDGSWSSEILNTGQSYSYTFTTPGTYAYWCTIHPDMLGTVIVK